MRVLLTLQYLGTRYAGWQSQTNATAIQDVVETALAKTVRDRHPHRRAGRTDAGVHARGQRAHADVPFAIEPRGFRPRHQQSAPARHPHHRVETVADDFHCRFAAKLKTYVYRIWNAEIADVFAVRDARARRPAARCRRDARGGADAGRRARLRGVHRRRARGVSSTVRTITDIDVVRDGNAIAITVTADGFLRYMVRRIAGSLDRDRPRQSSRRATQARWSRRRAGRRRRRGLARLVATRRTPTARLAALVPKAAALRIESLPPLTRSLRNIPRDDRPLQTG